MREYAINLLMQKDILTHFDMIETLRRGTGNVIIAGDDVVLIYNPEANVYFISAESPQAAARGLNEIIAPCSIVSHDEFSYKILFESLSPKQDDILNVYNCAYLKIEPVEYDKTYPIKILTPEYAEFMFENYAHSSIGYIQRIIENQNAFGIFVDGKLAGFIGLHSEGSIGLLHILPDYRRIGLAFRLEAYATNIVLERGEVPYCQVRVENEASLALQTKLGYETAKTPVRWIFAD